MGYEHESYGDDKYDHGYKKKRVTYAKVYKHEPKYEMEYDEPSYEKHDEYGYEEYDHKPTYKYQPMHKYKTQKSHKKYEPSYRHKRSVYGYGGDSYGKSHGTYSSYKPSYRHKRSVSYGYGGDSYYGKSYSSYEEPTYAKSYKHEPKYH